MLNLGKVKPGSTIYIPFDTFDSDGASVTMTGLAVGDIEVYKNGGTTQRASDSGYTLLDTDGIDFDGVTGVHGFSIDLADNSTAGFWEAGANYRVVVASVTVDSQTVTFTAAVFTIGYEGALLDTKIATLASQTSMTIAAGSADDDAYNGWTAIIHDVASAVQVAIGYVLDYTGSTKTITLAADPGVFTAAAGDNFSLLPPTNMSAIQGVAVSTSTAQLGVNVVEAAGTAWGSGAITAAAIASDAITAAKIAANSIGASELADNAITAAKIASDAITATKIAADAITASKIATDAIGADQVAAGAVTEIQSGLATAADLATADGKLDGIKAKTDNLPSDPADQSLVIAATDAIVTAIGNLNDPDAATVAAAVWGALRATYAAQGTFGECFSTIKSGTVSNAAFSPTTTEFEADDITEATADHFNNRRIIFTTGALSGQILEIQDYELSGSNGHFTTSAATETPANDDEFLIY